MLTVLQFYGTAERPYAYVVLVDSVIDGGLPYVTASVTVPSGTLLEYVALLPSRTINGANTGADGTFPADSAQWPGLALAYWAGETGSLALTLYPPFTPFVWRSTQALQFLAT
jgi:hypothetical protein